MMSNDQGFTTNYMPLSDLRNASAYVIEVNNDSNDDSPLDTNISLNASAWIHSDLTANRSQHFKDLMRKDFVFDRTDVRIVFISLYSLVFCCCFCGMYTNNNHHHNNVRIEEINFHFMESVHTIIDVCVSNGNIWFNEWNFFASFISEFSSILFALLHCDWMVKTGNFLVILVVVMSRRLRSITNFFLANLAVADFCVGVFCVLQNLSIYLIDR